MTPLGGHRLAGRCNHRRWAKARHRATVGRRKVPWCKARRNGKAPVVAAKWSADTRLRDESRVVRALRARYRAMMTRAEDPGTIHRPTKIDFTYFN